MQRLCQDITTRSLTCQIKTDVKLKHMRSLIGLAFCYFAGDVKLTAVASSVFKSRFFFIYSLK